MTISYQDQFFKLLLRWRGSLWRSIWKDLLVFLALYYAINVIYRYGLKHESQENFKHIIALFSNYIEQIPLTFLLGFYVGMVIKRWWEQFQLIAYPDDLLWWTSGLMRGSDREVVEIRRQVVRLSILSAVLAWRSLSVRVLARFPTEAHIVSAGLMTPEEFRLFNATTVHTEPHNKWFLPLNWIQSLFSRAYQEGKLCHTNEHRQLLQELQKYRDKFFQLFLYDYVTIPLVYTQVATITVYGYFAFCLLGRQYPRKSGGESVDIVVPVFTILQFLFYVGWLKVGEDLMFPFGSDDEDFDLNYVLDRNLELGYLIVDNVSGQEAPRYGDSGKLAQLPHTVGSVSLDYHPPVSHVAPLETSADQQEWVQTTTSHLKARKRRNLCDKLSCCCCRSGDADAPKPSTNKVGATPEVDTDLGRSVGLPATPGAQNGGPYASTASLRELPPIQGSISGSPERQRRMSTAATMAPHLDSPTHDHL